MFNALVNVHGYPKGNILLLISDGKENNAKRSDIIDAIEKLRGKVRAGDEVVFFYSGHGARGRADDGDKETTDEAIVPYERTTESLIWDGELMRMFSTFPTTRIIFIFDSCYAGGMTDLKADGRVVAMACSESGLSYEFSALENGQFTYYFVDQVTTAGDADIYDYDLDGTLVEPSDVVIEEAFDYAKANCIYQVPTIGDSFPKDLLP